MSGYRDYVEDATAYIFFTTNDALGAAVAPSSAFEAADVKIYKDGSATQKTTTNGITMTSPFDGIVGLHLLTIDMSVDTGDSGFWVTGSDYKPILDPDETVDSQIVVAGLNDFSIENGGIPTAKAVWDRLLTGATHNINNSAGKIVRALQEFLGYLNAAVWINTIEGTSGTENFINGTAGNPVDNMADANTLAASLGLSRFEVSVGSSITLAATQNNQVFNGHNWTLALGSQDLSNTHFFGADVSGIGMGTSNIDFHGCRMGACTLDPFHMIDCGLESTITVGKAGDYVIYRGHSAIAGSSTPIIDTGAAIANVNLAMPDWHNGIEIRNLNNVGTDLFSISGIGQIIYAASSSGAVNQRGDWKVTNTGGVTITEDDNTAKLSNLPEGIQKNAALDDFEFFMVDSTDHVTGKTGVTVTSQRSIDGGAFAVCANLATEVSAGVYKIDLAASDLNGDVITFKFTGTDADARLITIKTNV